LFREVTVPNLVV